jgi:hypothetical protein
VGIFQYGVYIEVTGQPRLSVKSLTTCSKDTFIPKLGIGVCFPESAEIQHSCFASRG